MERQVPSYEKGVARLTAWKNSPDRVAKHGAKRYSAYVPAPKVEQVVTGRCDDCGKRYKQGQQVLRLTADGTVRQELCRTCYKISRE